MIDRIYNFLRKARVIYRIAVRNELGCKAFDRGVL